MVGPIEGKIHNLNRTGQWEPDPKGYECEECGSEIEIFIVVYDDGLHIQNEIEKTRCPNCGWVERI